MPRNRKRASAAERVVQDRRRSERPQRRIVEAPTDAGQYRPLAQKRSSDTDPSRKFRAVTASKRIRGWLAKSADRRSMGCSLGAHRRAEKNTALSRKFGAGRRGSVQGGGCRDGCTGRKRPAAQTPKANLPEQQRRRCSRVIPTSPAKWPEGAFEIPTSHARNTELRRKK